MNKIIQWFRQSWKSFSINHNKKLLLIIKYWLIRMKIHFIYIDIKKAILRLYNKYIIEQRNTRSLIRRFCWDNNVLRKFFWIAKHQDIFKEWLLFLIEKLRWYDFKYKIIKKIIKRIIKFLNKIIEFINYVNQINIDKYINKIKKIYNFIINL